MSAQGNIVNVQAALRGIGLLQDLRRDVGQRAARDRHGGVGVPDLTETEVDELQVVGVLRLMHIQILKENRGYTLQCYFPDIR